ncbi:helix-turn-helix domain-containing protein [Nocardioides sp. zg-1230]|uniref:helix-turn-helix domain-containing protein n=1 Tax=Nocardioides sp. zg-1230 TaxID=2736601 RepID=UPI0015531F48|nr:helix-turn-helix domain-containing protein [Nocardioides sp. zg-1230]NPC44379.1 helix-turn-helix domain-containing protein [Nocardioides sp. zg-1230]
MRPADVVLHPVRMRIVQAFLGDRELTTSDLRAEIADVPSATLYRQVAALARGGVLIVVDETRVRGAVERTYRLRTGTTLVDGNQAREMTVEEHRQMFLTFVVGLLADFDHYLDRGDVDMARDLAGFRQNAMYLTDEEMAAVVTELRAVLDPRIALPPAPGRTRRLFSTVLMPDANAPTTTSTTTPGNAGPAPSPKEHD